MLIGVNNSSLGGITQFVVDESTGKITGYTTEIGGSDTVFPFRSDYFFLNEMESTSYNASTDAGDITITIPTDDCYILYGTVYTANYGVAMRTNSQTSLSISNGITQLFEAVMSNNCLIGLIHCNGLKGQSLKINTGLTVYRMSARIYY